MQNDKRRTRAARLGVFFFALCLLLFTVLGAYQLGQPGLHYDEAKEAGLNAMELITGQPVTAFRDATVPIGPWRLPLMVQDYIGALNVALAVPFLAIGGLNVVALRWLSLLTGALTLLMTWRVAWRLGGPLAASATALLLAVNPTFIFWSRQGVFVTNLSALIFMTSLLTGLRWWETRRPRDLWLTAFLWGLGVYAKLTFIWAIGAMLVVAGVAWLLDCLRSRRRNSKLATANRRGETRGPVTISDPRLAASDQRHRVFILGSVKIQLPADVIPAQAGIQRSALDSRLRGNYRFGSLFLTHPLVWALLFFLLPLIPLIVFNLRTGGTLHSVFGNLGQSYYGVNNSAYLPNLLTRLDQLITLLRGEHLGYLGGPFANAWAPWFLLVLILLAGVAIGLDARRGGERGMLKQGREGVADNGDPHTLTRPARHLRQADHGSPPVLRSVAPLLLLALMIAQSAFTVSDLFITHYALLVPLIPLAGGLAFGALMGAGGEGTGARGSREAGREGALVPGVLRVLAIIALVGWAGSDLVTDVRYHRALAASGGHGSHSDAIYALAEYLDRAGVSAPVALDWGLDAQIRYLTAGRVQPTEVFGYDSFDAPDPGYAERMNQLLDNPGTLYLAHLPEYTVFRERINTLADLASKRGMTLRQRALYTERDGTPLIIMYRAEK